MVLNLFRTVRGQMSHLWLFNQARRVTGGIREEPDRIFTQVMVLPEFEGAF